MGRSSCVYGALPVSRPGRDEAPEERYARATQSHLNGDSLASGGPYSWLLCHGNRKSSSRQELT
jgi:hypothetical protein